jgi:hypothetical protein
MNLSLIAGWRDSACNVTPAQERSGDLILKDANICAVDEHNPQVQAVAVKGDGIIFVNSVVLGAVRAIEVLRSSNPKLFVLALFNSTKSQFSAVRNSYLVVDSEKVIADSMFANP